MQLYDSTLTRRMSLRQRQNSSVGIGALLKITSCKQLNKIDSALITESNFETIYFLEKIKKKQKKRNLLPSYFSSSCTSCKIGRNSGGFTLRLFSALSAGMKKDVIIFLSSLILATNERIILKLL